MNPSADPYLSVVVASRNDDHGGDPLRRTQIFVNALFDQCQAYRLPAEIVLVDWNPPRDRPGLHEALCWSKSNSYCSARVLCVPPELHARLEYSSKLPFFQMIAKNAGIRNARGDFVLATNMDILFSAELIEWVAKRQLDGRRYYRVDRFDVENSLRAEESWRDQLEFCWKHVIRMNQQNGIVSPSTSLAPGLTRRNLSPRSRPTPPNARPEDLHTVACGDFTLMSREAWHQLRGYPEFEAYSYHIDSLICYMAHYGGVLETVLHPPCVAFHIEHALGSGFTPEGARRLFLRLEEAGIPYLEDAQLFSLGSDMQRRNEAIVFNDSSWGFGLHSLQPVAGKPGCAPLLAFSPVRSKGGGDERSRATAVKHEYAFDRLQADYFRNETRRLRAELSLYVGPVPPRGKGTKARWTRTKARWKRSFSKRLARL